MTTAVWVPVSLVAAGAALAAATLVTARPPRRPLPSRDAYLVRWRELHGGVDPDDSGPLTWWLRIGYALARPLARWGLRPTVLTLWSLWLALAAVAGACGGDRWPLLAGGLVVASGVVDTLDGAVAVATGRVTRWGYVLDSTADRVADLLFLAAVAVAGAPPWLAAATGVVVLLLEYMRARAGNAGGSDVGTVTVGERPARVGCCAVGLWGAGLLPGLAGALATVSLAALAVVTVIGLVQLGVAVRQQLAALEQAQHSSRATMRADSSTSGSPPPGWLEPPTR